MRELWPILAVLAALAITGCQDREVKIENKPVAIIDEHEGIGAPAKEGDLVTIDYIATMPDGKVIQRKKDYRFELGRGTVILAIDEAVFGMKTGGERTVDAPPHKHWGRAGYGTGPDAIPPNTRLTFVIKLRHID